MTIRLEKLLDTWQSKKDELQWILATVIETAGSSYRKKGAVMLINSLGQSLGLVSGGCLEADIMRKARKTWDTNTSQIITYDMRDEDDISWQLGIGCGGMVKLLLQPINEANNYLCLHQVLNKLQQRQIVYYLQSTQNTKQNQLFESADIKLDLQKTDILHTFSPRPELVVIGGGTDAIPLIDLATTLGWKTVLIDKRVGYARSSVFKNAETIVHDQLNAESIKPYVSTANAIVMMTHNVKYDAEALIWAQQSHAQFVGLLGPKHRTEKVLSEANLSYGKLQKALANPIGLDLGGDLPEVIALSICAQIQGVLEGKVNNTSGEFGRSIN